MKKIVLSRIYDPYLCEYTYYTRYFGYTPTTKIDYKTYYYQKFR